MQITATSAAEDAIPTRGFPKGIAIFLICTAILALLSPNPLTGLLGVITYYGIAKLLWRPTEPQALLFALSYQWIQAFAAVLQALIEGQSIENTFGGDNFATATNLSFLGLLSLAIGVKIGGKKDRPFSRSNLKEGLADLNQARLLLAWVITSIVSIGFAKIGASSPSIRQALIAFETYKWLTVFLVFQRWLIYNKGGAWVFLVFTVELGIGTLGFFSSFKQVFFIALVAATSVTSITGKSSKILVWTGAFLVLLMGFWQVIKNPYRSFLSQGERSQTVDVSIKQRLEWLQMVIPMIDGPLISAGWQSGLRRIAYIEYFGHAMNYVPVVVPHTNGKLWGGAVMHPLTPRFLFPSKPSINDSDRTNAYTGQFVADASEGTSVSIGYIGESYIDFGIVGMFFPIFLWGGCIGFCASYLRRKCPHAVFGSALSSCLILTQVLYMESSNIKLTGGLLSSFLVTAVLIKFYGKTAWNWLTAAPVLEPRKDNRSKDLIGGSV